MSVHKFSLFACFVVILCCAQADPISFIKPCSPSDNKCLKESTQAALPIYALGVPEFGIKSLDPLTIDRLDASASGLTFIVTDAIVTGLKDCRIKKITRDLQKSKIFLKAECSVNLEGTYDINGRLLILEMKGKGPLHVKLHKILINVDVDVEEKVLKDGKKHWNIKSSNHNYELKDKADVQFENLFEGNDVLGRTARDIIEKSGTEIVTEVGAPVIKSIVSHLVNNVNRFFHKAPLEDLVLE